MNDRGKSILVAGAGRSGIAAARFLLARGAHVILTDTKTADVLEPQIAPLIALAAQKGELVLELGGHRYESFARCDLVIVSPGIPLTLPMFDISRKAGIPIIAEVELAFRHLNGKIVGITGSNGKTTTTTLVSRLLIGAGLKGHAAGNIGAPLIGFVDESSPEDIYAVELSSFQLEGIQEFRPTIAAILNLTPDHLDRYTDFEAYIAAKRRIFMNQRDTDFAVLNADDPRVSLIGNEVSPRAIWFSRLKTPERGAFIRNGRVLFRDETRELDLFGIDTVTLKGTHNLENVLAACAMALLSGAAPESLEESIRKFPGVEHRIEFIAELNGVQYYNDSKATNVDATIKSIEAFKGNILLIAGGRDKAGNFNALRPSVRERVKHVVTIGEAAETLKRALADVSDVCEAESMQDAVSLCRQLARPGDVVLLAPACASFDMFRDYEHRGRVFKEAVRKL
jgi:UDP-N-acetylmuramoylalanine--D-glutamate ligase